MGKKHVLVVPGRYQEIKQVCEFVASGAEEAGLDENTIFHIELCCDEACTNVIEHAYGAEDVGEIVTSYKIENNTFTITIQDFGRPFNPDDVPPPFVPPTTSDPNLVDNMKAGGLGIHFMRKLMDEVRFRFDAEKGNTLVMVKNIPTQKDL